MVTHPAYFRRLIVAIKSPTEGYTAVSWASRLARELSLPVDLVFLVDEPGADAGRRADLAAIASDQLALLMRDPRLGKIEIESHVLVGSASDDLVAYANRDQGAVIMMVRPIEDPAASLAENAAPNLRVPYIVLPATLPPGASIRKLVVGRDTSALAERVIRASQTLGASLNVDVVSVEAIAPGSVSTEEFLGLEPHFSHGSIRVRGEAGPTLVVAARLSSADVIVVGAHGFGGARQPALGRTAEWLVRNADLPVMVVPEVPEMTEPVN